MVTMTVLHPVSGPVSRRALVGRTGVFEAVAEGLRQSGRVVLRGPAGAGKSAVLAEVGATVGERGSSVVRVDPGPGDHTLPYSAVADVFAALPPVELPDCQAHAVAAVLRRTPAGAAGVDPVAVRFALAALLGAAGPVLLTVDDAARLDAESVVALDYALRRLPDVSVLLAGSAGALCGRDRVEVTVPPLDVDEVAELLALDGVPYRLAWTIHRLSGGFPRLARELGRSNERAATEIARAWIAAVPARARLTLLVAALTVKPTLRLLRRACGPEGEEDAKAAVEAGLLAFAGDEVRFTAEIVPATLVADSDWSQRAAAHAVLAENAGHGIDAVRHRALSVDGTDFALAAELAEGAETSVRRGDWSTAAELGLLAAERTPSSHPRLLSERLVTAAGHAGRACRADLVHSAAEQALTNDDSAETGVRVRLAIVDVSGQALDDCEELLAEAEAIAGEDDALVAAVLLRQAGRANLAEGDPARARSLAARAAVLAARCGDAVTEVMALTMRARMERVLGDPASAKTLHTALNVSGSPELLDLGNSPRFLMARHALFDDRLADARSSLLALMPAAQRAGAAEYVEISRSLAEVEARAGRCADAVEHARRAVETTVRLGLSPGPSWYTAAVAETAGGSFTRAAEYARHGVEASRQERDVVFLSRNLHAWGLVELVTGEPGRAVEILRQVSDLETANCVEDPSLLRWHGDFAEALAATGETDEARELIDEVRHRARLLGRLGVLAVLDRSLAACSAAEGKKADALALLSTVEKRFDGLPVERGRTLLAVAKVERRSRHWAAARAALEAAVEVFTEAAARPWRELAVAALGSEPGGGGAALTAAEQRLSDLVVQGASNQEAADRLFLSVKTVEAMLTRIYRKLGVSSRAQLGNLRRTP
jgi:DNA-binding CsgD family transcriptional regulator